MALDAFVRDPDGTLPSARSTHHSHRRGYDAGYPREEPCAGKPPARICGGKAKCPSYSTTTGVDRAGQRESRRALVGELHTVNRSANIADRMTLHTPNSQTRYHVRQSRRPISGRTGHPPRWFDGSWSLPVARQFELAFSNLSDRRRQVSVGLDSPPTNETRFGVFVNIGSLRRTRTAEKPRSRLRHRRGTQPVRRRLCPDERLINRSSSFLPARSCAFSQRGCLPRPDQVSDGFFGF
jgi:hypothetical protein